MNISNSSNQVIADGIRLMTLHTLGNIGFGHIGGAMSIVETLAVLYGSEMRFDPNNPKWEKRDRLVMSKGHAGPALYATLCMSGYFPRDLLLELNQGGGRLPSHCDMHKTPGIDMTTGSLGQGMSTSIGIALGLRLDGSDSYTYLILGDGECNEGQVWEGAMFAAHHNLDNLIAFVDWNKLQLDGLTKEIIDMGDIGAKFASFGWHTQTIKGHDTVAIQAAIKEAKKATRKPSVIILDTIKGYGCDFAMNTTANHHMNFTKEEIEKAIVDAEKKLEQSKAKASAKR